MNTKSSSTLAPAPSDTERNLLNLLRTTLDASINGIISMSAIRSQEDTQPGTCGGKIVDFHMHAANKAVFRMLSVKPESLVGKTLLAVFPGNSENGFFDLYVRVAEGGEPEQSVQYYEDEYGLQAWFEISAVNQGKDQLVITFNNVTEQKLMELQNSKKQEQLNAVIQELRRSNENLQQFAYVASHDLQEPLRKIQSFGQIIRKKYSDALNEEGQDLLSRMESAAERMTTLINHLLDYSKLSIEISPTKPESLNRIIQDVKVILEQNIRDKKAVIKVEGAETITVNSLQLTQMFQNLLTNSLKFCRENIAPVIKITITREHADLNQNLGRFGAFEGKREYCVIEVRDNGIGFEQEQAENIFGTFQRLHGKSEYPGTGIGLAIVKKVVENHNGYIYAEGFPGAGSVFTIYLPL